MITKHLQDFDIHQIASSGQCFRLRPTGPEEKNKNLYTLTAFGRYLEIAQEERNSGVEVCFSCTEEEFDGLWSDYFDLGTDYGSIKKAIDPADAYLREAARLGSGIRILRQELWETIVTFIISQQNNISRIQKCVDILCREFGETGRDFRGNPYQIFPTAQALSRASEEELRRLGLGYRAPYLVKTARMAAEGEIDLGALAGMDYEGATEQLLKLCGVGKKVADCISLFALHHIEAFPVDTHIQAMLRRYPEGFPFERYKGFAGVLQQYAFYYELHGQKENDNGTDK